MDKYKNRTYTENCAYVVQGIIKCPLNFKVKYDSYCESEPQSFNNSCDFKQNMSQLLQYFNENLKDSEYWLTDSRTDVEDKEFLLSKVESEIMGDRNCFKYAKGKITLENCEKKLREICIEPENDDLTQLTLSTRQHIYKDDRSFRMEKVNASTNYNIDDLFELTTRLDWKIYEILLKKSQFKNGKCIVRLKNSVCQLNSIPNQIGFHYSNLNKTEYNCIVYKKATDNFMISFGDSKIQDTLPDDYNQIVDIILQIGFALSLLGGLCIIVTALKFIKKKSNNSYLIKTSFIFIAQLALAHIIEMIFMIISRSTLVLKSCIFVGISLHYILLVTFMWGLCFNVLILKNALYPPLKKNENESEDRKFQLGVFSLICWGIPWIPPLILIIFTTNAYQRVRGFCYPREMNLYLSVSGPIIIITLTNIAIIIRLIMIVFRTVSVRKHYTGNVRDSVKIVKIMLLLLNSGLPWMLGFLRLILLVNSPKSDVIIFLDYFFNTAVAFQGFFLFLNFIVFDKHIHKMWRGSIK